MATEGWAHLSNSTKWHYFTADGRSLCRKWMTFQREFEQGNDASPDNCAACRKKLGEREKLPVETAREETGNG